MEALVLVFIVHARMHCQYTREASNIYKPRPNCITLPRVTEKQNKRKKKQSGLLEKRKDERDGRPWFAPYYQEIVSLGLQFHILPNHLSPHNNIIEWKDGWDIFQHNRSTFNEFYELKKWCVQKKSGKPNYVD